MRAVDEVLEEIGAGEQAAAARPQQGRPARRGGAPRGSLRHPDAVLVSAIDGEGLDDLRERVEAAFEETLAEVELLVPYAQGARLHELHELAGSLERTDREDGVLVHAKVPTAELHRFEDLARRLQPLSRLPRRGAARCPEAEGRRRRCPRRAHEGDAGLDLYACEAAHIGPGERWSVGTGIAVEIPAGHAGLVLPRSGLAREHGIALVNSPGLIDSGYRGEVSVLLLNTDPAETFRVEPGDRIAQLVIAPDRARRAGRGRGARRVRPRRGRLRLKRPLASAPARGRGSGPGCGRRCRRRRSRRCGPCGGRRRPCRRAARCRRGRACGRACSGSASRARWRRSGRRRGGAGGAWSAAWRALGDPASAAAVRSAGGGGGAAAAAVRSTVRKSSGVALRAPSRSRPGSRLRIRRSGCRSAPCRSPAPQSITGSESAELARIESFAGAGEVGVRAGVAEQLVGAAVADQGVGRIRSPRDPRCRRARRRSPLPQLPAAAGGRPGRRALVEPGLDASAEPVAPRRRCRGRSPPSSVSPSQIEIGEEEVVAVAARAVRRGRRCGAGRRRRRSARERVCCRAAPVDEQVFAAFAAGQLSSPSPPSRIDAGRPAGSRWRSGCRCRPARRARSSRAPRSRSWRSSAWRCSRRPSGVEARRRREREGDRAGGVARGDRVVAAAAGHVELRCARRPGPITPTLTLPGSRGTTASPFPRSSLPLAI